MAKYLFCLASTLGTFSLQQRFDLRRRLCQFKFRWDGPHHFFSQSCFQSPQHFQFGVRMNKFIFFGVMSLWFGFADAADSLYGGFSAQSPPGSVGRGTVWSISVNAAALTIDPASLDLAIPGGPLRNYVRRSSTVTSANTITWIGTNGVNEAILHRPNRCKLARVRAICRWL